MKKELALLQKLYGLYNTVMVSINGYYDIVWTEVDIEKIKAELNDLSNRWLDTNVLFMLIIITSECKVFIVCHKAVTSHHRHVVM